MGYLSSQVRFSGTPNTSLMGYLSSQVRFSGTPNTSLMGYRQAVRHKTLTLARASSNLATPANMVDIVQLANSVKKVATIGKF